MTTETTNQKRKTKERKARQAELRYVASLRKQIIKYQFFGNPDKFSKEKMEAIIRRGKRRYSTPGMPNGMILAMAAVRELHGER